jgi:hypothetical protein
VGVQSYEGYDVAFFPSKRLVADAPETPLFSPASQTQDGEQNSGYAGMTVTTTKANSS